MPRRRNRNADQAPPPELPPPLPIVDVGPLSPELPPLDLDEPSPVGDVLVFDSARMQALKAKGVDTVVTRVRIEKFSEAQNRFARLDGEYPPDLVTVKWLRKKFGPGSYSLRGCNTGGMFLTAGRVTIEAAPDLQELPALAGAPTMRTAETLPAGMSFTEMLLLKLLDNRAPAPAPQDEMRESLNAMARMIALQTQTATMTQLKNQAMVPQSNGHGGGDERLYALLEKIVNGAPARKERSPLTEFLPLLQLGIQLGARASGMGTKENPEPQLPPWMQIMPDMADSLGVPLIAAIVQAALPPDKAQVVIDTINEHQRAKQEQAKADAAAVAAEGQDDA